ncbi:MAG TPA: hypothetical protein VK574_06750 [Terracidiphilus sp.]|nr:hypothetical protein [Terracidiphilus sp.]
MPTTAQAQTASDAISKRIAEVTKPVDGLAAPEKKRALTWEEEELQNYEPKRAVAVEEKRKADGRAALLVRQLPHQWNALCEVMSIRCESVNTKASRTVLRGAMPDPNRLEIRREDEEGFLIQFDPDRKKVTFSGKVLGFERVYELVVQDRDGVDATAWFSQTTLLTEQTDDLAKGMISTLMRFDQ